MAHRRLLTPFQGALIHLLLIGIPLRFGFPVVFESIWRGEMKSPCFMYEQYSQNGRCLTLERFLLKDYVHRFLLWYTLALFAAWTIQRTGGDSNNLGLRRLNRVLVVVTFLNVFGLAYLQHFGPATFTSSYFSLVVFNSLLAIAISVYVCQPMSIPTSKKPAKWSLPGTALFGGLSVSCMVVVASVQTLWSGEDGITQYIHASIQAQVTPIVTSAFWMATLQSLLVAMHSTQESWRFHDITTIVHCVFIQTLVKRPSLSWTAV
mmetsp:Transcript_27964/g.50624  ORF Transcript_27964/g.50624 Transcript_27964/m.50624 type:complete len:263 (+) Transcript_27964:95-883(+)